MPRNITRGVVLDSLHYDRRTNTLVYYHTMDDALYTAEAIRYGKKQLRADMSIWLSAMARSAFPCSLRMMNFECPWQL